jgi:hypothetical protein
MDQSNACHGDARVRQSQRAYQPDPKEDKLRANRKSSVIQKMTFVYRLLASQKREDMDE